MLKYPPSKSKSSQEPYSPEEMIEDLVEERFPELNINSEALGQMVKEGVPKDDAIRHKAKYPVSQDNIEQHVKDVMPALEYYLELSGLAPDELQARYDKFKAEKYQAGVAEQEAEDKRRFYYEPTAMADFDFWSKADCWTLEEAVALCHRRDPRVVNAASLKPYRDKSPFAKKFEPGFPRWIDMRPTR